MKKISILCLLLLFINKQYTNNLTINLFTQFKPKIINKFLFRDSIIEQYSQLLIQFEGQPGAWKYVEANKFDKGGENNMGLTLNTYEGLCQIVLNVKPNYPHFCQLTTNDCRKFIKWHYDEMKGDSMDLALAIMLTESAWMSGVQGAKIRLKSTLLHKFNIKTTSYDEAMAYCKNRPPIDIVAGFTQEKKDVVFWTCLNDTTQNVFKYGWIRRIETIDCFINDEIINKNEL
jgi:lysozyme family protein